MASAGTASVDIELNFDNVDSALDNAIAGLEAPPLEVPVDADLATLESDLASLEAAPIDVPVDADVAAAAAELEGLEGAPVDIPVTADTAAAQQSIDDLSGSIGALGDVAGVSGAGGAVGGLTGELGSLAGASGGAAAALGVAVGALGVSVSAAADAQVVVAETDSILASLGDSAVVTGDHIAELSQRVMEYSGFSDEAVQSGANTLLMFEGIQDAEVFDRAIESAADLAVRMGTDVPGAARLLGVALSDPENGMGRLKRVTGDLTDAQKAQIAAFLDVGDVAGAQEVILSSLEGRIGNLAEDYGQTLPGSMDRARESMDELAESTGQSMLPALESLADLAGPFGEWTQKFHDATGNLAMGPIAGITGTIEALSGAGIQLEGVGTVIGELPPGLEDTAAAADAAASEMQDFTEAMSDYLNEVVGLPASQRDVQESITDMVTTMQDSEASWFDMADAQDEMTTSTADLIENMRTHGATQAELDGTIDSTIGMLRSERDAGRLTQDQFRTLADEIRGIPHDASTTVTTPGLSGAITNSEKFAQKAKELDKLSPSTAFTAPGLSDAYSKSVDYLATLNAMDGKVIETTFKTIGSPVGKRAAGGPVEAGMPYIVGEERPELFVPDRDGTIVPSVPAMAAAGPVYNITNNISVPASSRPHEFAQAVVDAMVEWERGNGAIPVRTL